MRYSTAPGIGIFLVLESSEKASFQAISKRKNFNNVPFVVLNFFKNLSTEKKEHYSNSKSNMKSLDLLTQWNMFGGKRSFCSTYIKVHIDLNDLKKTLQNIFMK